MQTITMTIGQLHQWMRNGELTRVVRDNSQGRFAASRPAYEFSAARFVQEHAAYLLRNGMTSFYDEELRTMRRQVRHARHTATNNQRSNDIRARHGL